MNIPLLILFILFLVWGLYLFIRDIAVFNFRIELNHACYLKGIEHVDNVIDFDDEWYKEHERIHKLWDEITDIPYNKMLFSFTPLKPEYWLNEEQLEFLGL